MINVHSAVVFSLGLAAGNIPLLVRLFISIPGVSAWIRSHPATAEAIVNELKTDVDAAVKIDAAAPKAS